jgi:hypothetical protein
MIDNDRLFGSFHRHLLKSGGNSNFTIKLILGNKDNYDLERRYNHVEIYDPFSEFGNYKEYRR